MNTVVARRRIFYGVVALAIMIITALAFLTIYHIHRSIEKIAETAIQDTSLIVSEKLNDYFEPLDSYDSYFASNWKIDRPFIENAQEIEVFSSSIVRSFPQITSILVGTEAGDFVMFKEDEAGNVNTRIIEADHVPRMTTDKLYNGNVLVDIRERYDVEFDPRTRPWYSGAIDNGDAYFTEPYEYYSNREIGITASKSIHNDRAIFGVYGFDITLSNLEAFLDNLSIVGDGESFIVTAKDYVILSENSQYFQSVDGPLLADSFWQMIGDYRSGNVGVVTLDINGKKCIAKLNTIQVGYNSKWILGVVVDLSNYQSIYNINTIFIILASLLLISLLAYAYYIRFKHAQTGQDLERLKLIQQNKRLMYLPDLETAYLTAQTNYQLDQTIFTLMRCNIDDFTAIKIRYRDVEIDDLLMEVSSLLGVQLRRSDYICRWDDDFIMLLSDTSLNRAYNVAEKLRQSIAAHHFTINGNVVQVRVSIGLAAPQDGAELAEIISIADENLAVAKATGKNKTIK